MVDAVIENPFWKYHMRVVYKFLGFSKVADVNATKRFITLLEENYGKSIHTIVNKTIFSVSRNISNAVLVCGAGDSLERVINLFNGDITSFISKHFVISADSATTILREYGYLPNLVLTDLDGDWEVLQEVTSKHIPFVIHAHGDNVEKFEEWFSEQTESLRFIPSVQTEVVKPYLSNFAGFTDGDRSVWMALSLGFSTIKIMGFDLNGKIGRASFTPYKNTKDYIAFKLKKLSIAKQFLEMAAIEYSGIKFYNIQPSTEITSNLRSWNNVNSLI